MFDEKAFRIAAAKVGIQLEAGMHPEYDHGNGCVCAIGLTLAEMLGHPVTRDVAGAFVDSAMSPAINALWRTSDMTDKLDQKQGAEKIRKYLVHTE